MKELILLRHAKSNHDTLVDDIDRPLSVNGIMRIKKVVKKNHDFFKKTDIIISSPANRALHTAQLLSRELRYDYKKLMIDNKLYTFSSKNVIDQVHSLDNNLGKVVLVGHNPAFTNLANHFSKKKILHLRTAGLAKITFSDNNWLNVSGGKLELG